MAYRHLAARDFGSSGPRLGFPAPGFDLPNDPTLARWTANGAAVSTWSLYAGSAPGKNDHFNSGPVNATYDDDRPARRWKPRLRAIVVSIELALQPSGLRVRRRRSFERRNDGRPPGEPAATESERAVNDALPPERQVADLDHASSNSVLPKSFPVQSSGRRATFAIA